MYRTRTQMYLSSFQVFNLCFKNSWSKSAIFCHLFHFIPFYSISSHFIPFHAISFHSLSIQNELYTIRRRGIGVGITLLLVIWLLYCLPEESLIAESICNIPPSQIILLPNNARMTPYTWYYTWAYLLVTITNRRCDPNQFFGLGKVPHLWVQVFRFQCQNCSNSNWQILTWVTL